MASAEARAEARMARGWGLMRIITAALIVLVACACASAQTPAPHACPDVRARRARPSMCARLVSIGPRPAGSPGAERTRAYISQQLSAVALATEGREKPFVARTPLGPG